MPKRERISKDDPRGVPETDESVTAAVQKTEAEVERLAAYRNKVRSEKPRVEAVALIESNDDEYIAALDAQEKARKSQSRFHHTPTGPGQKVTLNPVKDREAVTS